MPTVLTEKGANAVAAALTALLDGGSLILADDADTPCATLGFAATAYGAPAAGVAISAALTPDEDADGGEVAVAIFKDDADDEIMRIPVEGSESSAEDVLKFNTVSTVLPAGALVRAPALTHTVPCTPAAP